MMRFVFGRTESLWCFYLEAQAFAGLGMYGLKHIEKPCYFPERSIYFAFSVA